MSKTKTRTYGMAADELDATGKPTGRVVGVTIHQEPSGRIVVKRTSVYDPNGSRERKLRRKPGAAAPTNETILAREVLRLDAEFGERNRAMKGTTP